jgi:hypothetical protein
MPKYRITECYQLETNADEKTVRELIVTGVIPEAEYQNYQLCLRRVDERFFFHSFEVIDGENTYEIKDVFTLAELHEIANRTGSVGSDDELAEDSHMILCDYGYTEIDDVDDSQFWNKSRTVIANLSHIEEINELQYKLLKERL